MAAPYTHTILVVDDDPVVASMITDALTDIAGYEGVITCTGAHEALRQVMQGRVPAVVVADYHMPQMNGIDLLTAIQARRPDIRGIIITADPAGAEAAQNRWPVVSKTDSRFHHKVLDLVETVLGEAGGGGNEKKVG